MRVHAILFLTALAALVGVTGVAGGKPPWPDLTAPLPKEGDGAMDAAVIAAVEDYAFLPDISGARRNASAWTLYLTQTRGISPSRVLLLRDQDVTRERLLAKIAEASKLARGGRVWVIFIGHGAPHDQGGAMLGFDTQPEADSLTLRGVTRAEVVEKATSGDPSRVVVVLDACFSGNLPNGDPLVEGLQPFVPVKDLRKIPDTVTLLTAARGNQFAGPLPGVARPAFSYLVLGGLRGWADNNADGAITASEITAYAEGALRALVPRREQTPQLKGTDIPLSSGQEPGPDLTRILLAMNPGPTGTASATAPHPSDTALRMLAGHTSHRKTIVSMAASPDGQWLATASEDKTIKLWHLHKGTTRTLSTPDPPTALAFSPNGTRLAVGDDEGVLHIFDLASNKRLRKMKGHSDTILSMAFAPNGKLLATGDDDGKIILWDARAWSRRATQRKGHDKSVRAMAFSPNSALLASASRDHTARLWSTPDLRPHKTLEHNDSVYAVAFSPDGQRLATAGGDHSVRLWIPGTGGLERTFAGHKRTIRALAFSDKTDWLLSGDNGGVLFTWNIATGAAQRTAPGATAITAAAIPGGDTIALGTEGGAVLFWDAADMTRRAAIR